VQAPGDPPPESGCASSDQCSAVLSDPHAPPPLQHLP
jgi:hypothetical protein